MTTRCLLVGGPTRVDGRVIETDMPGELFHVPLRHYWRFLHEAEDGTWVFVYEDR